MNEKITKKLVDRLEPASKQFNVYDRDIRGFHVKVMPTGRRSYFYYYRSKEGRERRPKIGEHGSVTCEEARHIAKGWAAEVAQGKDPSESRNIQRTGQRVADLAERFMNDHVSVRNKPKTIKENQRLIDLHILPAIGKQNIASIRREDIAKLHHSMRKTQYQANRVVALISKMFNLAEKWGLRPEGTNPTRHIEKYKEVPRQRYLRGSEFDRLGKSITKCENNGVISSYFAAAIRLLILTGCRASEIRTLKWEHVDFERSCLRLPDSKTGAKDVVLNTLALEVLHTLKRIDGNPYVIVGLKPGASLTDFEKPWQRLRKDAGLEDVRLHDLRHSFAGVAASAGVSAPIVGRLLGHKTLQATERYAHIAEDPARQASEGVGRHLERSIMPRIYNDERNDM